MATPLLLPAMVCVCVWGGGALPHCLFTAFPGPSGAFSTAFSTAFSRPPSGMLPATCAASFDRSQPLTAAHWASACGLVLPQKRYTCRECKVRGDGGAGICDHMRIRYTCKDCHQISTGGNGICEHERVRCHPGRCCMPQFAVMCRCAVFAHYAALPCCPNQLPNKLNSPLRNQRDGMW